MNALPAPVTLLLLLPKLGVVVAFGVRFVVCATHVFYNWVKSERPTNFFGNLFNAIEIVRFCDLKPNYLEL